MDLANKILLLIRMSRFEINWFAGKIRLPRASGWVVTYTLQCGLGKTVDTNGPSFFFQIPIFRSAGNIIQKIKRDLTVVDIWEIAFVFSFNQYTAVCCSPEWRVKIITSENYEKK